MKKIVFIVGTRPEFIKVAPVYKTFKADSRWEAILISTGQHATMLDQLYKFFEIKPDVDLGVMQENQTLSQLTSNLLGKVSPLFDEIKPDFILVQGDTTTTFVASIAAFYQKIQIIHLEAGLRTGKKYAPFPEEINRRITSVIADFHFCPTQRNVLNLKQENIVSNVYSIGNTVIDSLLWAKKQIEKNTSPYDKKFNNIFLKHNRVVLITAHRRESFGGGIKAISLAIKEPSTHYPNIAFVYPVHLNPNVKSVIDKELAGLSNVFLLKPLAYDEIVYLLSRSYIILTDSGGIQEEAPAFDIPVLVLRETTERNEAVESGACILVGTDQKNIVQTFREIVSDKKRYQAIARSPNPYGKGDSAIELKNILSNQLSV